MRWILSIIVVLAACKGDSKKQPPPPGDWKPIEALATTEPDRAPATDLVRALDIAKTNGDAWRQHKDDKDVAAFPQGADALSALAAWTKAQGGLPPLGTPMQFGVVAMAMSNLGTMAVATAKTLDDLAPAEHLAGELLARGRNLLEVQIGLSLLDTVKQKCAELTLSRPVRPDLDLVRVLAAEALQSRASIDYAQTQEGRKELDEGAKEMAAHERKSVPPKSLVPSPAEARAMQAFWLAALRGAEHGEAQDVTLARLQSAVDTAPAAIKDQVAIIPRTVKLMIDQYAALK